MTRIGLEQRGAKRFTLFCTFIQPVRYEYRGRRDVYTGAARIREGGGSGAHVDTGDGNNLGLLYAGQGKMAEAEEMYVQALRRYEKVKGADHSRTQLIARNLNKLRAKG